MPARSENIEHILQSCLEMIQSERETMDSVLARFPEWADELRLELEAAAWLQSNTSLFNPRSGFVQSSQRRLAGQMRSPKLSATEGRRSNVTAAWRLRGRRIALQGALALILLVALFTGSGGVALASQSALPGEQLYPVKLSLENASLALTPGRASQARLHIEYAQRRLIEIQSLVLEGSYAQIPQTVTRFEEQVNQAAQALNEVAASQDIFQAKALATSLHETLAAQTPLMSNLYEVVPGETQPEFKRVLYVSESGMMAAQGVLTTVPSPAASPDPMAVSSTPSATEYFIVHSSTTSPLPPTTTTTPTAAPVSADTQPAPASPGASSLPESPTQTPVPNGSFPLVSTTKPSDTVTATSTPEAKKTKKPTRTPKPKRTGKPGKTPKPSHTPKPKKD